MNKRQLWHRQYKKRWRAKWKINAEKKEAVYFPHCLEEYTGPTIRVNFPSLKTKEGDRGYLGLALDGLGI